MVPRPQLLVRAFVDSSTVTEHSVLSFFPVFAWWNEALG